MAKQGFIQLHRKIQDHWLYQEKRTFSKFEAWIDMLMLANHKDNKFLLGSELVEVKRGQFITSIRKLEDRWNWSNTKINRFLKLLKDDEMIVYKSDTKKTIITIANYDFYHDNGNRKTSRKHHESDTLASQKHTNNNVKNDKNDKKKDYSSKIRDLLSLFSQIDNFNQLNKKYWDVIRETRKTGRIAESVIYNTMNKWTKYELPVVEYALKNHIDNHKGKREEYTIGIMRNTPKEEAESRLNNPVKKKGEISLDDFNLDD